MTIAEAAVFWSRSWRHPEEDYLACLERVGLSGDLLTRPSMKLSGGERRKALVALTVASPAPVVVLDEPTVGLDLDAKASLADLLADKQTEGKAILVCTHELDFAERVAQRFEFLVNGRIRRTVTADEVVGGETTKTAFLAFKTPQGMQRAMRKLSGAVGQDAVSADGRGSFAGLSIEIGNEMDFFEQLVALPSLRPDLVSVEVRSQSLASMYEELTGQGIAR
jgi:ABC-type multidrug transport system ATPase subunit